MKTILSLLALVFCFGFTQAQDKIVKTTGEELLVTVVEVGVSEIKYKNYDSDSEITFSIEKDRVSKVILESGEELTFKSMLDDPEVYALVKDRVWKFDLFSPLLGATRFGYQQMIAPGRSWQANVGIIGFGIDPKDTNPYGGFVEGGYRFQKAPEYYMEGMRRTHPLNGKYFQPTIVLGYFNEWDYNSDYYWTTYSPVRDDVFYGNIMLNAGIQNIYGDAFVVDFQIGVGYGISSDQWGDFQYSGLYAGRDVPLAFNARLNIGLLTH